MVYKYFYYISSEHQEVSPVIELLKKAKNIHNIEYEVIDISTLTENKKQELIESLRVFSRKNSVNIKTKGKGALPISRSGKLGKDGILVQKYNGVIKNVFPNVKNGKRTDCLMHLKKLIQTKNIDDLKDDEYISEKDISRMIISLPDLIEKGLKFLETEVEVEGGRIDAVFKDSDGKSLLIEVELIANDNAIAQVQRFKIPYSEKYNIPLENIRLGIVCTDISKSRINACITGNIEVYKLALVKTV